MSGFKASKREYSLPVKIMRNLNFPKPNNFFFFFLIFTLILDGRGLISSVSICAGMSFLPHWFSCGGRTEKNQKLRFFQNFSNLESGFVQFT